MHDLTRLQRLLLDNWERRNRQLSQTFKNSLVGLTDLQTLTVLAQARRGEYA